MREGNTQTSHNKGVPLGKTGVEVEPVRDTGIERKRSLIGDGFQYNI